MYVNSLYLYASARLAVCKHKLGSDLKSADSGLVNLTTSLLRINSNWTTQVYWKMPLRHCMSTRLCNCITVLLPTNIHFNASFPQSVPHLLIISRVFLYWQIQFIVNLCFLWVDSFQDLYNGRSHLFLGHTSVARLELLNKILCCHWFAH